MNWQTQTDRCSQKLRHWKRHRLRSENRIWFICLTGTMAPPPAGPCQSEKPSGWRNRERTRLPPATRVASGLMLPVVFCMWDIKFYSYSQLQTIHWGSTDPTKIITPTVISSLIHKPSVELTTMGQMYHSTTLLQLWNTPESRRVCNVCCGAVSGI